MKRLSTLLFPTLIVLLAAFVRFHNLEVQSFWYDEGLSYMHSQRTLGEIIAIMQIDVHTPGYFWVLSLWENVVGSSEFALRALSAFFSVVSVAATYTVGRRLFGIVAGHAAATFVALNTFSIYYAQETRMYAMLTGIAAMSMAVYVGWLRRLEAAPTGGERNRMLLREGLALGLLNAVGLYTHISYGLVMLAQGVMALLWLGRLTRSTRAVWWRGSGYYTLANLLTVALFAPWVPTAIRQTLREPNISQPIPLAEFLQLMQGWLTFGITYEVSLQGMGAVVYFLLLFGLIVPPALRTNADSRAGAWWELLLPVVWALLSVSIYTALALYLRYTRFLLPAQLAVALWMGRGIWVIWHVVPRGGGRLRELVPPFAAAFAGVALSMAMVRGLDPLYNDPAYTRDDFRGLVQEVTTQTDADDAIILSAEGTRDIFEYYYDGQAEVFPLPPGAEEATREVVATHDRVVAVLYGEELQDPARIVSTTLNQAAFPLDSRWVGDMQVRRFRTADELTLVPVEEPAFGEHIVLENALHSAGPFAPGAAVLLELTWRTTQPLDTHYKVFVQLLNEAGQLVAQRDSEPVGGSMPTVIWSPDTAVVDRHALLLPADLAPGEYTLIVGLYDAQDPARRLTTAEGQTFVSLMKIQLE